MLAFFPAHVSLHVLACTLPNKKHSVTQQFHPCSFLQVIGSYIATYVGFGCFLALSIPVWRCPGCELQFLPKPAHVGCFGATPIRPHTWFDIALFHQYASMSHQGTSCSCESSVHLFYFVYGDQQRLAAFLQVRLGRGFAGSAAKKVPEGGLINLLEMRMLG